jgi:hypothetical protein
MDNIGPYVTYGELLLELARGKSSKVKVSAITLANKTVDVLGDLCDFTVASGDPAPKIGDVIEQAGYVDCIKEILTTPDRIRLHKTGAENQIQNGPAQLLHSDDVSKGRGEALVRLSMARVDRETGQFFNKRSGVFQFEGNNSPVLFLNVPIIEIRSFKINSTEQELIEGKLNDFLALKGRTEPQDDRWNPRIKLNTRTDNIFSGAFTNRVFLKDTFTEIDGDFGFLEVDGNTPLLIKEATLIDVIDAIENPEAQAAGEPTTGSLKRLKVDIHEQEFFEPKGQSQVFQASTNERFNRIMSQYRRPILIGGSFREIREKDLM